MSRASSPENKDKKKKKKSSEKRAKALLSLKADQKKEPVPAAKSLNSLKKIQSQLDRIVKQRNKEKKYVKELKNTTQTIAAQLDHIESRFPGLALNIELKQVKTVLKEKTTELQHNTDKLTREISIFRDLMERVEDKILTIEKDTGSHKQQIQNLQQSQAHLFEKISLFEKEVNKFSAEFVQPEQTAAEFTEQLNQLNQVVTQINQNHQQYDTQIKLLQTDTGNIRKSLQQSQNFDNKINNLIPKFDKVDEQSKQMTAQALKIEQQSEQHYKLFDHKILAIGEAQQSLIKPLEIHLKQLEERIQSLNHDSVKQQAVCSDDEEKLTELSASVARFDGTLQQSQDELKQHIQLLRESDAEENSEQFNQVSKQLEQLAQQLADVEEQSSALQTQLKQLQEQQSSTGEHHDELSRQYLNQQQQLQHHDNQLASAQNSLLSIDETLQSNLSSLTRNLDTEHARNQQKINEIESLQQEQTSLQQEQTSLQQAQESQQQQQAATLTQLSEQIKTRSQLFSIGLITVLMVSGLLFFSQETAESESEKQTQIAQIKSDITNETFSKINTLTKQNSSIINTQLNQIRSSIQQVSNDRRTGQAVDFQPLQDDWQARHQLLQEHVLTIQTEQQTQDQSISKLSDTVSSMTEQVQQLQKTVSQKPKLSTAQNQHSAQNKLLSDLTEVPNINTLSRSFYTIQLLGALQKDSIKHFLKHHKLTETSKLYQTELQGRPWYILLYGNYSSFSQAKEQLQQLPEFLLQYKPWIRKLP